jgi:CheY-like chemotaxis protein
VQVLTNLLHNASKYTRPSGRIWVSAECAALELIVRVRDTGIGIVPEMRERIFGLFEQAPPAVEYAPGGLGIGLTLVRSVVHLHGGTVAAHSAGADLGSEFIVRLPVVQPQAPSRQEPTAPAPEPPEPPAAGPLRVLVVDDSPAVAISLKCTIELWDHLVETSPDAFAALEAVRTFRPNVVLADLGLPRMNGYQLAAELRRLPQMQGVPLLAVSGFGQESDVKKSHEAGFSHHLVKPIKPDELKQILAAYAAQSPGQAPAPSA